jgi:hypothetical protein
MEAIIINDDDDEILNFREIEDVCKRNPKRQKQISQNLTSQAIDTPQQPKNIIKNKPGNNKTQITGGAIRTKFMLQKKDDKLETKVSIASSTAIRLGTQNNIATSILSHANLKKSQGKDFRI